MKKSFVVGHSQLRRSNGLRYCVKLSLAFFKKMGHPPRRIFHLFWSIQTLAQILQQIYVKNDPCSILCRDFNS